MSDTISNLVRATHALATVTHPDAHVYRVGILLQPHLPEGVPSDARGISGTSEEPRELGEKCGWTAQVRLGNGDWGHHTGYGKEPEDALLNLFEASRAGLTRMEVRRAGVMSRVAVEGASNPGCQWHSVTCHPTTKEPDGYITVDAAGEVRVDGKPLSEVKDLHTLLWVAQVVPAYLATGKRAPSPSPTR